MCLTAKVLYTRYELHVKVFLYYSGFTFVKEEDVNYNKEFDAFISFSHDDDEFVIKDIISGNIYEIIVLFSTSKSSSMSHICILPLTDIFLNSKFKLEPFIGSVNPI